MICDLCPRRCGALRTEERGLGRCRMPELPVLARAALHRWEEPPISGTRGSGTIFFSGCSLGCVFCQNEEISHRDFGKAVTLERLARICGELVDQGAHNLNFVNPTHYAHVVGRLLEEHPNLGGIIALGEELTLGAADALQQAGSKASLVGFGAAPEQAALLQAARRMKRRQLD